jgi:Tfp pilus assembly protein PilN
VITVNLLAGRRQSPSAYRSVATAACMLTTCAVALAYGFSLQQARGALRARSLDADAQVADATSLTKRIEGLRQRHAELVRHLAAVRRALDDRATSSELFKIVSRSVPGDVRLIQLKRSAGTVELDGRASSLADITRLVHGLSANLAFARGPELRSVVAESTEDGFVLRFLVVGDLSMEPPG